MGKKTGKLVRTGLAIAATTLAEAALQRAAEDPRLRRKAKEIVVSTGRTLQRTVKKVIGKRGQKISQRATVRRKKSGTARSR